MHILHILNQNLVIKGRPEKRPYTAPGLGVCEWSPEGLYNKSVSWIPDTDEILQLVKKKNELIGLHLADTQAWSCRISCLSPSHGV